MFDRIRKLFAGPTTSNDPRTLFAIEIEALVSTLPNVQTVTRSPDAFALDVTTPNGVQHRFFLDNAFDETRELSPDDKLARIAFMLSSLDEPIEKPAWDEARETFVPVLRGATYGIEIWAEQPNAMFVRRPFLPYVDELVGMDRRTSVEFVGRAALDWWNVTAEDLFAASTARAHLLADPAVELYDKTHGPLWNVATNDTYESSRLLVPGWLASFEGKVDGRPIAIVPERGTLMVGGDGRRTMIERLLDTAGREFGASNRRISPVLYTADAQGKVVPYALPAGDALARKLRLAQEQLALYEHDTQKQVLERLYEERGLDVFVSSYQVFETDEGGMRSSTVWVKGVRTYMPRTERVILLTPGEGEGAKPKSVVDVAFEEVEERLTRVDGLHPERFETVEFPE